MKVALVVPDPALGPDVPFGDSMRLRLLQSALESLGHEVAVYWAQQEHATGDAKTTRVQFVPSGIRPLLRDVRTLAQNHRFERRLSGLVDSPDVILEFASYLAPAGLSLAQRLDVPYIVEVEGPLATLRYENGRSPLRPVGEKRLEAQLRSASAVLAVSAPLADHLSELGAERDRVIVAPNVADTAVFRPDEAMREQVRAELGLGSEMIVVGFHGVFSPWYSLPRLVAAAGRIESPTLAVLLVGDGVERGAVEIAARENEVQLVVTGFVPQARAAELAQAMDVGVVPDHAWWTSPLKLFELGALHKPVIAANVPSVTAVGSPREIALFDASDKTGLQNQLSSLAADPGLRESFADAWHARVLRDYTLPALRQNIERALKLAIS
jgi:glycosyltransferase involved in cell wall biosynthesis